MLETLLESLLSLIDTLGYGGIFLLMTIESSFVPFPSELVIPPAAYLAHQGEMNIYLVILFGILGSLAGALINYYLAFWLGRPMAFKLVQKKIARYFLLSEEKLVKAEKYFLNYGGVSTFVGRLIPGIRQLISLPAGFFKMPLLPFLFFTFLGAGIWTVILALQGYLVGVYKEVFVQYLNEIIVGIVLFAAAIYGTLTYLKRRRRLRSE